MTHATTWLDLINSMLSERRCHKRDHILYDSVYMKCPEKTNLQRQKVNQWPPGSSIISEWT